MIWVSGRIGRVCLCLMPLTLGDLLPGGCGWRAGCGRLSIILWGARMERAMQGKDAALSQGWARDGKRGCLAYWWPSWSGLSPATGDKGAAGGRMYDIVIPYIRA